jgi:hypothetical protein
MPSRAPPTREPAGRPPRETKQRPTGRRSRNADHEIGLDRDLARRTLRCPDGAHDASSLAIGPQLPWHDRRYGDPHERTRLWDHCGTDRNGVELGGRLIEQPIERTDRLLAQGTRDLRLRLTP